VNAIILAAASDRHSDNIPGALRSSESAEPRVVSGEKKLNQESAVSATPKSLLRGVGDSADAFGPLKSATGASRGVNPPPTTSAGAFRSGDGLTIKQLFRTLWKRILSVMSVVCLFFAYADCFD
jgi:hypothetical protein